MVLCIPVTQDQGLQSNVSAHFGSAPMFMIVDTDSGRCRAIQNRNDHHAHGMCQPVAALAGERVDGVVVGGIGAGALSKFQAAKIQVFLSEQLTIEETIAALREGALRLVTPEHACQHHAH